MASSTSHVAADDRSTTLVRQNLRLVARIGRQFANRGVDATDLIQEGSIGLITASRRFDEKRGVRFTTYATWWIRQGMGRAIAEQGRTVRLPYHVTGALREIAQTAHDLVGKLGRPAASAEIAACLASTPDRIERLLDFRLRSVSLDAPGAATTDEVPLMERIAVDPDGPSPDDVLEARARGAVIREALARLSVRERALLSLRFGIDCDACSLLQASTRLGIHVHQARQIYQRAVKKLQHNSSIKGLRDA
jgi:RNA polymerase primary sigma factor